ncbi:MAG: hypothetical protein RLZZ28_2488 [Bacteroidota bacterium]|jgi:DNA-binding NarL/FixJ family response regulator
MIRIALVDDHVLLRNSMRLLLEFMGGYQIMMEAGNGRELMEKLNSTDLHPHIVLMDITMKLMNGIEATRRLRQEKPDIKVIALSMLCNEQAVMRMINNGARAYLLKDAEPRELDRAIQEVHRNGYYFNELAGQEMISQNRSQEEISFNTPELRFIQWACTELTHQQIAREMQVSPRTIDGYRDSLFEKLKVQSRIGIVMYAFKNGLVSI